MPGYCLARASRSTSAISETTCEFGTYAARLTRLTVDSGQDQSPLWTPNERIVFTANHGGQNNLLVAARPTERAPRKRLTMSPSRQFANEMTPEWHGGSVHDQTQTTASDLMQRALAGTRRLTPLVQTKFNERNGVVSRMARSDRRI